MKVNVLLGFLLAFSGSVYAAPFVIPDEYKIGTNMYKDGFYILEILKGKNGDHTAVFIFSSLSGEKPSKDVLWITECFNAPKKGLTEFKCTLQQKDFYVSVTNNEKIVAFNKKNISTSNPLEVNYKIDSNSIITEKYQILLPYRASVFLRQFSSASKFSYSWKGAKGYIIQDINMVGFKESYEFVKKMIEVNK